MRLSELYTSIQGEGPNTGKATQFVRFGGCNYRCALWPCDSPYAIDPKLYRHEWKKISVGDLITTIDDYPRHLCFTGGEPFLQPKGEMDELVEELVDVGYTIDFFTNGSFPFPEYIVSHPGTTMVLDWKLPGSGEWGKDEAQRMNNARLLWSTDAIKFTVADMDDLKAALSIFEQIWPFCQAQYYVGPVWGKIAEADVAKFILDNKLPWHLNVQLHKYVWDENAREI